MWLVERDSVGAVAYGRLQRDGAIRTLIPGVALPADVADSPAVRRHVLRRYFPAGCQATGLAALWIRGHGAFPAWLDIRTHQGRHVRNWRQTIPLAFHSVGVQPGTDHSNGFTHPATAIADALRWTPLELALPAVLSALQGAGNGDAASDPPRNALIADVTSELAGTEREASVWRAICGALTRGPSPRIVPTEIAGAELA